MVHKGSIIQVESKDERTVVLEITIRDNEAEEVESTSLHPVISITSTTQNVPSTDLIGENSVERLRKLLKSLDEKMCQEDY